MIGPETDYRSEAGFSFYCRNRTATGSHKISLSPRSVNTAQTCFLKTVPLNTDALFSLNRRANHWAVDLSVVQEIPSAKLREAPR